jgi:hypothetical protein
MNLYSICGKRKRNLPSNRRDRRKEPTLYMKRKVKGTYLLTGEK